MTFICLFLVRSLEFSILPSFFYSPFNCTLAISADRSMSQFSSNLPPPPKSRFSRGPGAASSEQPLVPSSSPIVVPTSIAILNPLSNEASSLAPVPSHGHSVNENIVTPAEPLEPAPRMDKGKKPTEEGFQRKRKRAVSVESDESIPKEGLMADARRAGVEEKFQGADLTVRLANVTDCCRQLPLCLRLRLCLRLPIQWLNECLNKADWKDLRQRSQGLPYLCDTMVLFYQVNSLPYFSFFFSFCFLTPVSLLLAAHEGHERIICLSS